jgi:histone H3/H4
MTTVDAIAKTDTAVSSDEIEVSAAASASAAKTKTVSSKQKGLESTKRHKKITKKDNNVPRATIRKLCRRAGVAFISKSVYPEVRTVLTEMIGRYVTRSVIVMTGRKPSKTNVRLKAKDMLYGINSTGQKLYTGCRV